MEKIEFGRNAGGQAQCRKRKKRRTAAWYGFLILAGVLLYKAGAVYALRWRGYYAVGGEVLIPLVLVLCYGVAVMFREIVRDWHDRR
ncbi:MAG: hypothetical protein HFF08_10560 [Oscillospiraceae bacterium]|nr:hypothetical protein [Oscillospiraceae bacterium]